MQYRKATEQDLDQIVTLVQETIKTIYPKYYPKEVVDFFCEHHCRENILNDVNAGVVGVLLVEGEIIGTGCYRDNHITRVYVNPACQKQGFGSYIMQGPVYISGSSLCKSSLPPHDPQQCVLCRKR